MKDFILFGEGNSKKQGVRHTLAEVGLAVIIGQGGYNDMGLIRSCGEAGMRVVMVAPENIVMPLNRSRYVVKWIKEYVSNREQLRDILENIRSEYGSKIIVYPASDLAACLVDEYSLESHLDVIVPNADGKLSSLMDKSVMVDIAQKSGLDVPESYKLNIQASEGNPPILPCIIKPLRSISGEKSDITICHDTATYHRAIDVYRCKGFYDVLVQELIVGDNQKEVAVTGVALDKNIVLTYGIIHKKRIRGNGSTVFADYKNDIDYELQDKIRNFIAATGYTGIFDMEFMKNENGYHFIECNFRNGAYGYAVTSAGFNMPEVFALGKLNWTIPEVSQKDITFMEERTDILNVLDHTISLKEWIRDFFCTDTFLWWNWRDPKPMLRIPNFIKTGLLKKLGIRKTLLLA